jgi:hypothetical protein
MSQSGPFATDGYHECANCGEVWPANKLAPIKDLDQRIELGGMVPSGECPDVSCGALCYPTKRVPEKKQ